MEPVRKRSRARQSAARLLCVWLLGGLAGCASGAPATDGAEPPGVPAVASADAPLAPAFTAEQATRGQRTFTTVCAVCHGRSEFTGPIFRLTWGAEPLGHLFEHISTAMPQDDPGSLSPEEYAAVVAYILQLNGHEPGDRELPADAALLERVRW